MIDQLLTLLGLVGYLIGVVSGFMRFGMVGGIVFLLVAPVAVVYGWFVILRNVL